MSRDVARWCLPHIIILNLIVLANHTEVVDPLLYHLYCKYSRIVEFGNFVLRG